MSKSQKQAVIDEVLVHLPTFQLGKDSALSMLSPTQLNTIKDTIRDNILNGDITYSKDLSNRSEVQSYARSMVMNHLKKAKELNGGQGIVIVANPVANPSSTVSHRNVRVSLNKSKPIAPKGVKVDLLTEDLKEYVKILV